MVAHRPRRRVQFLASVNENEASASDSGDTEHRWGEFHSLFPGQQAKGRYLPVCSNYFQKECSLGLLDPMGKAKFMNWPHFSCDQVSTVLFLGTSPVFMAQPRRVNIWVLSALRAGMIDICLNTHCFFFPLFSCTCVCANVQYACGNTNRWMSSWCQEQLPHDFLKQALSIKLRIQWHS